MAKKRVNMALSNIERIADKNLPKPAHSYFSGGISCDTPFIPDNVLVWKSSSDSTVTDVSIHQRMILKIILKGKALTVVDGIRIPMKASDMILFFPFQFHSTQLLCPTSDYSFLAITFTEKTKNYSPLLPLKNHRLRPDKNDAKNIEKIIESYLHPEKVVPEKGILSLMELLLNQRRKVLDSEVKRTPRQGEMFDRICDYFRSNFDKQISQKTVAAEFGISEETIRRMFHKSYGNITPGKLIQRLRMQFAIELLEHTDESIAHIAEKCGYADTFVFSKAFKRLTGISPLNHRKDYLARTVSG